MKKIMGVILSCLMFFNSAFNLACAANTETKNVSHSSKETRNKILKYVSVGALAAVGLLTAGGLAYAGYNYFSDTIEYPLIFDFDSKSIEPNVRVPMIKQMISKYQKSGKEFFVITQIEESEYVIERFDSGGNINSEMKVDEWGLEYLLCELYKVIPRKSGVYSGTEKVFRKIFDFTCESSKNDLPSLEPFKTVVKPDDLILHSKVTLTAVFYNNDEALKEFMDKVLEYEYNGLPRVESSENDNKLNSDHIGFSEKIPNGLKRYRMNTCHVNQHNNVVTKLVPIDYRKFKNMSPLEYEEVQKLLEICMSGIIIFNYDDPELYEIYKYVNTENRKGRLKRDVNIDCILRLMCSASESSFLGCYACSKSKMEKEKVNDRCSKLQQYMERLGREFRVNYTWNTENQITNVEKAFGSVVNIVSTEDTILQKEPLVKEYIREHYKINIVN